MFILISIFDFNIFRILELFKYKTKKLLQYSNKEILKNLFNIYNIIVIYIL